MFKPTFICPHCNIENWAAKDFETDRAIFFDEKVKEEDLVKVEIIMFQNENEGWFYIWRCGNCKKLLEITKH